MLERDVEKYLVKRCKELGILCEKFTSPQRRNVPDRVLSYGGAAIFVELKATGKKPNAGQIRDHEKRIHHACVLWTDSKEGVDVIVDNFAQRRPVPYIAGFRVVG